MEKEFRIGQGIDVHTFCDGQSLKLGGVVIPFQCGLKGHSDADVLLHAITDALIGAGGKGDIGTWFPDTDSQWKDVDSGKLIEIVWREISQDRWQIANLDSTVVTEAPKLGPYIQQIRESVAALLGIEPARCNIKATTAEKIGAIGQGEGILATSVVLLERRT
jgi:2-C-methyl-D-erythritol 2,4-cyclodiphosphate synthase